MMPGVVAFPAVLARLKEIGAAENAFVLRSIFEGSKKAKMMNLTRQARNKHWKS
jgi:hypothetical protein